MLDYLIYFWSGIVCLKLSSYNGIITFILDYI